VPSTRKPVAFVKAVPWALLARTVMVFGMRWSALTSRERSRLTSLVRDSHGRPDKLSPRERNELRKLVRRLDLPGAGRELLPLLRGGKRGRKRR
jgi:hypothetical protein